MSDLLEFSRRITLRGGTIATRADNLVRKVALVADQAIVVGTPVDTGRARSNWIVQIGSSADSPIYPYTPGERGSTGAANAQAAIDQGQRVISNYVGGSGQSIHITNNLSYIQKLNDGFSAQASANFVETAVFQAVRAVTQGSLVTDLPGG